MNDFNKIELEFKDKGIVRGGILLLPTNRAIEIINRAEKEGLGILGVDAFIIRDDVTQPSQENSIEFKFEGKTNYLEVKDFINSKNDKGLLFEIVFDG